MKRKNKLDENKGKLLYKSNTPRKAKRTIGLTIIMSLFFLTAGAEIYLFIIVLDYGIFPQAILPALIYSLGSIPTLFFGFTVAFLLLRQFLTYLHIYEKGVEILLATFLPPKIKKEFIPFEDIKEVELKEQYEVNTLYVHIEDREAFELDEFQISDLKKPMNLILKKLNID